MEFLKKKTIQILLIIVAVLLIVFLSMLFGKREKEIGPDLGLFISWADGDIYFSKNGQIWEVADNTTLLTNGTRLRTGKDTKAILQTPHGSSIRMNENTEIKVAQANERDLLLVQHSGRTYHRVKMATEGIYQVRALNHTMKAVGTAFDLSTNVKANRINAKSLEGKINIAINFEEVIEVQSITKGKEVTVDPGSNNLIAIADINSGYTESDWFKWNQEEDRKIGYELKISDDISNEDEGSDDKTPATTTKTTNSTTTTTTPPPTTYSTGSCKPYLSAKKAHGGIQLNWTTCSNDDFQFYKLVRSTLNPSPSYPNDAAISSSSNKSYSSYIDKNVVFARTYHYRVCVVQRLNKVSCGNLASVTY